MYCIRARHGSQIVLAEVHCNGAPHGGENAQQHVQHQHQPPAEDDDLRRFVAEA